MLDFSPSSHYHGDMNEHSNTLSTQEYNLSQARAFLNKVYLWMAASLMLTAGVAWYAANDIALLTWTIEHTWIPIVATFAILLVMCFGSRMLTSGALSVLLMTFAALEGLLFGPILLMYTQTSLALTFACTAGMFGAMGLYGAFTKTNLSTLGRTLWMLLIGIIIALIANWFLGSNTLDLVISGVGVIVFALFTAYDTQKIMQLSYCEDEDIRRKGAVLGAMSLYLDFINLFLFLLRFLGDRDIPPPPPTHTSQPCQTPTVSKLLPHRRSRLCSPPLATISPTR